VLLAWGDVLPSETTLRAILTLQPHVIAEAVSPSRGRHSGERQGAGAFVASCTAPAGFAISGRELWKSSAALSRSRIATLA